jgi:hypothetical protein
MTVQYALYSTLNEPTANAVRGVLEDGTGVSFLLGSDNPEADDYQNWLDAGGVPDPWVPPEPVPPTPTTEQELLFEHENRILALEGQPPITVGDFINKMQSEPPT